MPSEGITTDHLTILALAARIVKITAGHKAGRFAEIESRSFRPGRINFKAVRTNAIGPGETMND